MIIRIFLSRVDGLLICTSFTRQAGITSVFAAGWDHGQLRLAAGSDHFDRRYTLRKNLNLNLRKTGGISASYFTLKVFKYSLDMTSR